VARARTQIALDVLAINASLSHIRNVPLLGDVASGIFRRSHPGLAEGGIVTRPTLTWIGEKGPEAGIPLRGGGGAGGVVVNVHAGIGDPIAIGREIDRVLRAYHWRSGVA